VLDSVLKVIYLTVFICHHVASSSVYRSGDLDWRDDAAPI